MTDADLQADRGLSEGPAGQRRRQAGRRSPPSDPAMKVGSAIYADECSACHAPNGEGCAGTDSDAGRFGVGAVDASRRRCCMSCCAGTRSVGTAGAPTAAAMPPFGWLLNDDQVAAVTTYVRNAWGNAAPAVSAADVAKARTSLAQRSD